MTHVPRTFWLLPLIAVFVGCAGQPPAATGGTRVGPAVVEPSPPRHCLRETSGRLPAAEECLGARGVVLTREELERTGGVPLGDALRRRVPF